MSEQDLSFLNEDTEAPAPQSVQKLAAAMAGVKRRLDELEADKKELTKTYDEIRKTLLPDALAKAGMTSFALSTGEKVHLRNEVQVSVLKDDRARFHFWLRDNGHASLIQEQVNPQTLKAWGREQIENGVELPAFMKVYKEPVAVVTKGKS
jgi:hypothetical protein